MKSEACFNGLLAMADKLRLSEMVQRLEGLYTSLAVWRLAL